jgi:hypothetical protein
MRYTAREVFMFRLFSLPRINDISTDLQDPPAFVSDSGRPCAGVSYPSNFKSKVAESYSDLSSEPLAMSAGDAFARAVRIAGEMDAWEVVHTDSDTLQLEAVCTTSLDSRTMCASESPRTVTVRA